MDARAGPSLPPAGPPLPHGRDGRVMPSSPPAGPPLLPADVSADRHRRSPLSSTATRMPARVAVPPAAPPLLRHRREIGSAAAPWMRAQVVVAATAPRSSTRPPPVEALATKPSNFHQIACCKFLQVSTDYRNFARWSVHHVVILPGELYGCGEEKCRYAALFSMHFIKAQMLRFAATVPAVQCRPVVSPDPPPCLLSVDLHAFNASLLLPLSIEHIRFGITSALGSRSLTGTPLYKREGQAISAGAVGDLTRRHPPLLQIPYLLELKVIWLTCRGFRVVCGISCRGVASEMTLLGAAISCVDVLAVPMSVLDTMHETNVIRECTLTAY